MIENALIRAKCVIMLLTLFFLSSCSDRNGFAPVVESQWKRFDRNVRQYTVKRGDTLYSIAFRYDVDYRQMANYNQLRSPYTVRIGQKLRIMPPVRHIQKPTPRQLIRPVPRPAHIAMNVPSPVQSNTSWVWPARGRIVANFSPQNGIKGINISGKKGDKIYAASSGVVAYSGSGLAGYGNLIIIRHNSRFMTAYGHNLRNNVHEGQTVQKGQVIADMGLINRRYWGVHFEIRQLGKPVNPLIYLR